MPNENFFAKWGSPSFYPSEVNIKDTGEEIYSKSDEHLQFELDPKEYFKSNAESCITLIPQFLNDELIQKDPCCFIYGYNQILREICFNGNKHIALDTISEIVISSNGTRKEVTKFILQSGLAKKTENVLRILNMEDEWRTLSEVLEVDSIQDVNLLDVVGNL